MGAFSIYLRYLLQFYIMNRAMLICSLILLSCTKILLGQQSYLERMSAFRTAYKKSFLTDAHSPLKAADTAKLRFYPIDEHYCLKAQVSICKNEKAFEMLTHNGKKKKYIKYALLSFKLKGRTYQLAAYQSLSLLQDPKYQHYLFVPFNDATNYETSYAGGRYIDLSSSDIKNGQVVLDFNKAYNPYCAYAEGYSCPLPPTENRLECKIEAGEQIMP